MDRKKKNLQNKRGYKKKSNLSDRVIRQKCDCEATKHPLVNNCMKCGRIVCLKEGPGPCFYCGSTVSYNNEPLSNVQLINESDSKHKHFFDTNIMPEIDSAETLKLRDKLLEFDKNCASRTSVIDDECDYYQATNTWLSKSEREKWEKLEKEIQAEKHKSRILQKITVDFAGRVNEENEDPVELFNKMNSIQDSRNFDFNSTHSHNHHNESLKRPVYIGVSNILPNSKENMNNYFVGNRIQDKGILEISDQGLCLSMHQPYASLLVKGIKKTEGRTWYTSHRGRLWIASTVKEPHSEEIKLLQETYTLLGNSIEFPKTYPTGCLIGCVNVTDVVSQEDYNQMYPDNNINSPYIFICDNFFELPMKFPIQGKHKIYKLDPVIHRAVLNCFEKTCIQMSKNVRSIT